TRAIPSAAPGRRENRTSPTAGRPDQARASVRSTERVAVLHGWRLDQLQVALQHAAGTSFPIVEIFRLPVGHLSQMDPYHAALVQGETVTARVLGDALLAGKRRPRIHWPLQFADMDPLALTRPTSMHRQFAALVKEVRQGDDCAAAGSIAVEMERFVEFLVR